MKLAFIIRYTAFCLFAILVNLGLQLIAFQYLGLSFWVALAIGTAGGLLLKYVLDRNFIFFVKDDDLSLDITRFALYVLMGILTTSIFWVTEWIGYRYLPTKYGQYSGGALGLAVGYALKYWLDRRWVFRRTSTVDQS